MNIQQVVKLIYSIRSKLLLLVILILLALYFLVMLSNFVAPVIIWIKSSFLEDSIKTTAINPMLIIQIIPLCISLVLIFLFHSVVSTMLTYDLFKKNYNDYDSQKNIIFKQADPVTTIVRVINWNIYRLYYVFLPLLTVSAIALVLFLIVSFCFNVIEMIAGVSLGLVIFVGTFILLSLIAIFIYALFCTLKNLVNSSFGIECVVSEPELSNKVVAQRSKRLSFVKPINLLLHFSFLIFILLMTVESLGIIFFKNCISGDNTYIFVHLTILNILFYVGIGYFKNVLYVESIVAKYKRIIQGKNLSF